VPGVANPMTYLWKGAQYVTIAAGGHSEAGTTIGDSIVVGSQRTVSRLHSGLAQSTGLAEDFGEGNRTCARDHIYLGLVLALANAVIERAIRTPVNASNTRAGALWLQTPSPD
jgi:hypothetical protein